MNRTVLTFIVAIPALICCVALILYAFLGIQFLPNAADVGVDEFSLIAMRYWISAVSAIAASTIWVGMKK